MKELLRRITDMANAMEWKLLNDRELFPPGRVLPFVNGSNVKAVLEEAKTIVDATSPDDPRSALTIALAVGMGYGKTRLLQEAGNLLNCDVQIYVTYGCEQQLRFDRERATLGIFLRILTAFAIQYRPETSTKLQTSINALGANRVPYIVAETNLTQAVLRAAANADFSRVDLEAKANALANFIVENFRNAGRKSYIAVDEMLHLGTVEDPFCPVVSVISAVSQKAVR